MELRFSFYRSQFMEIGFLLPIRMLLLSLMRLLFTLNMHRAFTFTVSRLFTHCILRLISKAWLHQSICIDLWTLAIVFIVFHPLSRLVHSFSVCRAAKWWWWWFKAHIRIRWSACQFIKCAFSLSTSLCSSQFVCPHSNLIIQQKWIHSNGILFTSSLSQSLTLLHSSLGCTIYRWCIHFVLCIISLTCVVAGELNCIYFAFNSSFTLNEVESIMGKLRDIHVCFLCVKNAVFFNGMNLKHSKKNCATFTATDETQQQHHIYIHLYSRKETVTKLCESSLHHYYTLFFFLQHLVETIWFLCVDLFWLQLGNFQFVVALSLSFSLCSTLGLALSQCYLLCQWKLVTLADRTHIKKSS